MNLCQTICLLNDSFPPQIDGVSNTILNYAKHIEANGSNAMVVTPANPQAEDYRFSFPVVRYPSVEFSKMNGYMAGIPFSPEVARAANKKKVSLLHSHCPIMSTFMARELRQVLDVPIVLTYHTKFDIDIANITKNKVLQNACKKAIVSNIAACDEIWTVSRGAGENLRSMGYEGEYIIMQNGVDFPCERVSEEKIQEATKAFNLPSDVPVYLYVGRMMWYKGIRITVDALSMLNNEGKDFRMIFIGAGDDLSEIKSYARDKAIDDKCIFVGAIQDREKLRAWYCRSDLFLFPSTFDTNGLVVREAAACSLGSVLIKNSCAAEGVTDGKNGFLIDENAESMYQCLLLLYSSIEKMHEIGVHASKDLYISWDSAVKSAMERYEIVIDLYKRGFYPKNKKPMEGFMKMNGELMEILAKLSKNKY